MTDRDVVLRGKFEGLRGELNERQWRLLLAREALALGRGGIVAVARASGASRRTVSRGIAELEEDRPPAPGRVRRAGAGRRRAEDRDPALLDALARLVDPGEMGDPMRVLRWTVRSTRQLARDLAALGHRVEHNTVARLLKQQGFSLQGTARVLAGSSHPDRNAQFEYIAARAADFLGAGCPVISVDTKKKEDIGAFARPGTTWRTAGDPVKVLDHDFSSAAQGKAIPYGIYDVGANAGYVVVGTDHDTAAFAVAAIRSWWHTRGKDAYPHADRLLITADGGGSNGTRVRAWKAELAHLAAETGLAIHVSHMPPGTSKWNKVEHRLFSFITMTWAGRPLTSYDVALNLIGATTNQGGLTVTAHLDTDRYPTGIEITDAHLAALAIEPHDFHGEWNYTLPPRPGTPPPPRHAPPGTRQRAHRANHGTPRTPRTPPPPDSAVTLAASDPRAALLTHPALTGMDRTALDTLATTLHAHRPPTTRNHPPRLPFHEQLWATVLHEAGLATTLIAELLGTNDTTTKRAYTTIRPLLHQHGHPITPLPHPLRHTTDLTHHLTNTRQ